MHAVIILCHFCEQHGPAIVLCTQPYRLSDAPDAGLLPDPNQTIQIEPFSSSYLPWNRLVPTTAAASGCGMVPGTNPAVAMGSRQQTGSCKACTSIPRDEPGFISNDNVARTTYLSTQLPEDKQLLDKIKAACLRSLSCETNPVREGPIYFGDDVNGHLLSYTFQLSDSVARGLHGNFSIMVFTRDKYFLLNAWSFLVSNINRMVIRLQESADKVFKDEQSKQTTRAARLDTSEHYPGISHRFHRDIELRSLTELTKDDQVFYRVHSWFTWLLRATGRRWTEHVLEGSPREDQLVARELLESSGLGLEQECLLLGGYPSDSVDCSEEALVPIHNLRKLRKLLGTSCFPTVVYHTLIGNQIIVRSGRPKLNTAVLMSLTKMLPLGCVKIVTDSREYLPAFRCNLLGIGLDVPLPPEITASSEGHLLMELAEDSPDVIADEDLVYIPDALIIHLSKPKWEHRRLHLLDDLCKTLLHLEGLPDSTASIVLISLREHWVNKARLLFGFKRFEAPGLSVEEAEKRYRNILISLNCSGEDEALVRFWFDGLSKHFKQTVCQVKISS